MTQGFKDDKGNFRPTGGSKGSVSEKDLNISVKGNNDIIKVGNDLITKKKPEPEKFIHREPVIGYITNYSYGPRKQAVTLKVELRKLEGNKNGIDGKIYHNPEELSISGAIWNNRHSDCVSCGQNYDTLEEALKKHELTTNGKISNQEMEKLLQVWRRWHLNGMKSGTEKQNKIVDEYYEKKGDVSHSYEEAVKVLREHNLEVDNGYKYGTEWRYEPLPDNVIKFAKEIQEKLDIKEDGRPKE